MVERVSKATRSGGASDSRPGPTLASGVPLTATQSIDLSLVGGLQVDADGHAVTYSAQSDDELVQVSVVDSTLQATYPTDNLGSTRITVTATDEFGRQDHTSFDLNVAGFQRTVDQSTASVLTFDGPFDPNGSIDNDYGDRITSSSDGDFEYGGGINGPTTPNIEVDYSSTTRFFPSGFSGLNNVAFAVGGPAEVILQADPGYTVSLFGFDMGGYRDNSATPLVEVIDQNGAILFSESDVSLPSTSPAREFDFAQPLVGQTLTIRFARHLSGSNPIGIDNVEFGQELIAIVNQPHYGSIFHDLNGDGVHDPNERGIAGAVVEIYGADGTPILCSLTDSEGNYHVRGDLLSERYSVRVTPPLGWETSGPESLTFVGGELLDFAYEFDVDPADAAAIDLDNNGAPDFAVAGQPIIANGVATVSTNQRYGENTNLNEAWDILSPTVETGFIVDLRARILTDTGSQGAISLSASPDGTVGNALISIGANDLSYRNLDGSFTTLSTANNTADFHDFRIIQNPGEANAYYVYRDGILVNPGGTPLPSAINFETAPRLVFGDGGSAWSGSAEIDSIRFGIPDRTLNFGLTKPIDLGPDRTVVEGTPQTFAITSSLTLVDHAWKVTDIDGTVVASSSDSTFEFPAEDDGVFKVSVSASSGGETYVDQLLLIVTNANPVLTIASVQESANVLTAANTNAGALVNEGTPVNLSANATDLGVNDYVTSYEWIVSNDTGRVIASAAGSLSESEPIPGIGFTPDDEGRYEVRLTATDKDGGVGESSPLLVEITNVEPVVSLSGDATLDASGVLAFSGSFTDPGNDHWLGDVDYGDGVTRPIVLEEDKTFDVEYQYSTPGRYTVQVVVDDQDGGRSIGSFDVLYDPFAPIEVVGPESVDEHLDTSAGPIVVGELIAADETPNDQHTFDFAVGSGDEDNDRFVIEGQQLLIRQNEVVDYETQASYSIRVRTTDEAGNTLEQPLTIEVNDLPEPPALESIRVNDGSSQRSIVDSLTVTFDTEVDHVALDDAFLLRNVTTETQLTTLMLDAQNVGGKTIVQLTFASGASVEATGSLADGNYRLTIDAASVIASSSSTAMAADLVFGDGGGENDAFFRLLGDSDGDRDVDGQDYGRFGLAFNSTEGSAEYEPAFDSDHDGDVDGQDYGRFGLRFMTSI